MKTHNILRYGLMKRLKRGVRISIALTFRCNLKCPYCVLEIPDKKDLSAKPATLKELKHFIESYPKNIRLREIKLTGGSPEMHPNFVEFTNWLLDRDLYVVVFTNLLHLNKLKQLKHTRKLFFVASYHHVSSIKKFDQNYQYLKRFYRIVVEEIDDIKQYRDFWHRTAVERCSQINPSAYGSMSKLLPYSHLKKLIGETEMRENRDMLRVSPDLRIYSTCYNVYVNKNEM